MDLGWWVLLKGRDFEGWVHDGNFILVFAGMDWGLFGVIFTGRVYANQF